MLNILDEQKERERSQNVLQGSIPSRNEGVEERRGRGRKEGSVKVKRKSTTYCIVPGSLSVLILECNTC